MRKKIINLKISKYVLFISLISLNSCSSYQGQKMEIEILKKSSKDKLPFAGEVLASSGLSDIVGVFDLKKKTVSFIELSTFDVKEVELPDSIFDLSEFPIFYRFYIKSADSIFFISDENVLKMFDKNLNLKEEIAIPKAYPPISLLPSSYVVSDFELMYNWMIYNRYGGQSVEERKARYAKGHPMASFFYGAKKSGKISTFGSYPEKYKSTGNNYYLNEPYLNKGAKDKLVVSFSAEENVFIYEKGKLRQTKKCKSKYVNKIGHVPNDKLRNIAFVSDYQSEEPKYLGIYYDRFLNRYYRKVRVSRNREHPEDGLWSIIVLDENFEVLGEVLIKNSDYSHTLLIPTENGIYLKESKPDSLGYAVLTLVNFI